jgi:hypothetical protein
LSGQQHEQQPVAEKEAPDVVPAPRGGTGAAKVTHKLDPEAAWPRVDAVLKGDKKDLQQLPLLVTFLEYEQKVLLWSDRHDDLLKLGGDHVVDVARALGLSPQVAIDWALQSKPKLSADKLRRFLRSLPMTELADIDNFPDIRKVLTGKLMEELPGVIQSIDQVGRSHQLIRWLAETTNINLLATIFAEHGTETLARTLDDEQLWGWLDHVPAGPAFTRLANMRDASRDPTAKEKMNAVLGPMATGDPAEMEKVRDAGQADLHAALDDEKIDRAKVMDVIGRAGYRGHQESYPRIAQLMKRAKLSADDVLAVLLAFDIDVEKGLPTLLDTDGATKSHVLAFLARTPDLFARLKHDKFRNAIRGKLGKGIGLRDLVVELGADDQAAILQDEALRTWYLADATPRDLLSLCGAEADRAARTCRVVKSVRGMDWVYELNPGSEKTALRILATHCGDAKLSAFIRGSLLAEEVSNTPAIVEAAPENPEVYGGEKERLAQAEKSYDQDAVLARLADMDDNQRVALAKDQGELSRVLRQVGRDNRLRALSLLDLPFAPTVAYAAPDSGFDRQLVLHLRSRPVAEETAALGVKTVVERAIMHVHPDPLQTFPSLHEPKVLAKAIEVCPAIVERMLAGTEASRALSLLGHQLVRKKFEELLEAQPELVDKLPRYQHLDAKAQNKVDKIADEVKPDGEASDALAEVQDGTYEGDRRRDADASIQEKARAKATTSVADAIKILANEGGETTGAMALLREHHDEIVNMLGDDSKWPTIEKLAHLVDLPPDQVFNLSLDRLLLLSNARRWLFKVTPGFVLLHELRSAKAPAFAAVASDINHDLPGAVDWLGRLPSGAGLTDREEMTLDTIQLQLTNELSLEAIFKTRFGITPPGLDAAGLKSTYAMLSRLPDAHVQQQRIKEIKLDTFKGNEAGLWTGSEIKLLDTLTPGGVNDTMAPRSGAMTRDETRKAYGWDDAKIDALVKENRLEEKVAAGQTVYELPDVSVDKFTQVLLHEIGHSVDSILGSQTEVAYGMAGWRKYDEADFDRWATEMGGWDKVSNADQAKIRQAWVDALKSDTGVASMVDADHPARSKKYEGVGIVDAMRSGHNGMYLNPIHANGRTFIMQPYYGFFYSLKQEAANTAPSNYSLYAPAEYFAECYVEYYRHVDATGDGAKQKGGLLPSPVKKWFDTHVDKVRFDPKRLEKPEEET